MGVAREPVSGDSPARLGFALIKHGICCSLLSFWTCNGRLRHHRPRTAGITHIKKPGTSKLFPAFSFCCSCAATLGAIKTPALAGCISLSKSYLARGGEGIPAGFVRASLAVRPVAALVALRRSFIWGISLHHPKRFARKIMRFCGASGLRKAIEAPAWVAGPLRTSDVHAKVRIRSSILRAPPGGGSGKTGGGSRRGLDIYHTSIFIPKSSHTKGRGYRKNGPGYL